MIIRFHLDSIQIQLYLLPFFSKIVLEMRKRSAYRFMEDQQALPYFEVKGPEGQNFRKEIEGSIFTIGRSASNHLTLDDPQMLISRTHCVVEKQQNTWQVMDNGSVNGTFRRRIVNGPLESIRGKQPLASGESLCLLATLRDEGNALYWELTLFDPAQTKNAFQREPSLTYDWVQAKLFRRWGERSEEITLRPMEHKLIRFLSMRNQQNENVPMLCSSEELAEAIWGKEVGTHQVNHLVSGLRRKIELDPHEPKLLKSVKGVGYQLVIQ